MVDFQKIVNYIFVKQNNKDTKCPGLGSDLKTINNQLKECEYISYTNNDELTGVIVYTYNSEVLNILFAHLSDNSFNDKLKALQNELKPKLINFTISNDNKLNDTIEMKLKKLSYALEINHSIKETKVEGLAVCSYMPYIFDEYASLHKNVNKNILKQMTKDKSYQIYTAIYNNDLIGYIDINYNKCYEIQDLYLVNNYYKKEFIMAMVYNASKKVNDRNKMHIITSDELLINTLLECGFKIIDSAISYYL